MYKKIIFIIGILFSLYTTICFIFSFLFFFGLLNGKRWNFIFQTAYDHHPSNFLIMAGLFSLAAALLFSSFLKNK